MSGNYYKSDKCTMLARGGSQSGAVAKEVLNRHKIMGEYSTL